MLILTVVLLGEEVTTAGTLVPCDPENAIIWSRRIQLLHILSERKGREDRNDLLKVTRTNS